MSTGTITNNVYNVKANFGAVGDGVSNDTVKIQNAINAAQNDDGGVVWFPPGKYLVESTLTISKNVKLLGTGWNGKNTDTGSFIVFDEDTVKQVITITSSGKGASIENIGIARDISENDWTAPSADDNTFSIKVEADDVLLKNILLLNVTNGIELAGDRGFRYPDGVKTLFVGSVGRITLDRIFGQPMKCGIKIDNALDVIKIKNVHFWPFWSAKDTISNYTKSHGTGILSLRNDNPFFSDIFCLDYNLGMHFDKSEADFTPCGTPVVFGKTSKFKVVNSDFDFCNIGLNITAQATTGQITNFSCQGQGEGIGHGGVYINASDVRFQASNLDIFECANNGIRIDGSNTWVALENVSIKKWNTIGLTNPTLHFPGIEVRNGAKAYIGIARWFEDGKNGAVDMNVTQDGTNPLGVIVKSKKEE